MSTVNVSDVIDRSRIGRSQFFALALCALCLVLDGFDVQAMGYVAPTLIKQWGIAKADLGAVFGAGLVGMALGALCLGPVADRIGRRPVLVGAMLCLSAAMLASAQASSVRDLVLLRFAAGLAMGAIIPNAVALAGEFSPARVRVTVMMVTSSGFILGGAIGGGIAAVLLPRFGWTSVFIAGSAAPLALGLLMIVALPESPQFLALHGRRRSDLKRVLERIDPSLVITSETRLVASEEKKSGAPFLYLFRNAMGTGTVLLWAVNFMNLLVTYFLANWLPVIMSEAGHGASQAVLTGTIFWIGGIVGNLMLGWFVDRHGFGPTLSVTFLTAAVVIALVGQVAGSMPLACLGIIAAGFCILGGQTALNALAAVYYPTSVRSTGMGWALGVGRLGSIVGPVVGGELMRLHWSTADLFLAAAIPALLALGAVLLFWRSGSLPVSAAARRASVDKPAPTPMPVEERLRA